MSDAGNRSRWRSRLSRRRVPVIQQMSMADCGAACLAMILCHHGRKTTLHEVTELAGGAGRDGLSAQQLAAVGRKCGLRVKGYSLDFEHFQYLTLPVIAHWSFNHFVVVEQVGRDHVTVVDPGAGRMRLSRREFGQSFTGVTLAFEPGYHFEERRSAGQRVWSRYLRYLLATPGTWRVLAQILLASVLVQLLGLAFPLVTAVLVDHVIPYDMEQMMPVLGLGILALMAGVAMIHYLRAAMLIHLKGRLDSHLMLGFFEHVLALPYRFFQSRTSGDLILRLSSNGTLRETLTSQTLSTLLDGSFVLFYLTVIWLEDAHFGAITTAVGVIQVLLLVLTTRRVHDLTQRQLASQAASQSYLVESLGGMETIKAIGAEPRVFDHWTNLFYKQLNVSLERDHLAALIGSATTTITQLSPLVLVWVGATRVFSGDLSLGTMLALEALAAAFLAPLSTLVASGQSLQVVGAHMARIADVIETPPEQAPDRVSEPPRLQGRIELDDVSFRYGSEGPLVLEDIDLRVEPGTKLALVGPTGSGKSSLARLLLGLYEPTRGEIRYDGIPLRELHYRAVRGHFGVVMQDTFLFSGSIRDNITLGNPDIALARVVEAAELAEIHDDIERMPMGYDTVLPEGGGGLSGGQRQRLAIARALVHEPRILLLDEATSHLDAITEARIERNLGRIAATRIVVAHRLSTIRDADRIVVLQHGRIVESGDHDSLMTQDGFYARLVQSQT